jgi:hypothetical protein
VTTATLPFRLKSEEKSWIFISSMIVEMSLAGCSSQLGMLGAVCHVSGDSVVTGQTETHCE